MPLYSFYSFSSDGVAAILISADLPNDDDAIRHAAAVGASHPATVRVLVLNGERYVGNVTADLTALGTISTPVESSRRLVAQSRELLRSSKDAASPTRFARRGSA